MLANSLPLSGKIIPEFMCFAEWDIWFQERLETDIEARESFAFLQTKKCNEHAVKVCLFRILTDRDSVRWEEQWEATLRAANREQATRIQKDAEVLWTISTGYIGTTTYDTLQELCQMLRKASMEADRETTAERPRENPYRNCFLPILVAYVWRVTEKKHFRHLAALVRCVCRPDDPNCGYAADAVRQDFNRFQAQHPRVWKSIEKAVEKWCQNSVHDIDRLGTILRRGARKRTNRCSQT